MSFEANGQPGSADETGLRQERFPATRYSVVRSLGSSDQQVRRRAFDTLVRIYWRPVYKYVRLRWNVRREDAEDLTQHFFALAYEKRVLDRYDPARARFRTFLRVCVDGSVSNARKAASRVKRGGAVTFIPMDCVGAEGELVAASAAGGDVDDLFRREWIRAVLELAIERLREECSAEHKAVQFRLFERYDVQGLQGTPPTYADLAREFALPVTQVTNYLAFARRRFRHHALEALAELTGSDEEFVEEARDLFGIDV